jgi:hypothetical protein
MSNMYFMASSSVGVDCDSPPRRTAARAIDTYGFVFSTWRTVQMPVAATRVTFTLCAGNRGGREGDTSVGWPLKRMVRRADPTIWS